MSTILLTDTARFVCSARLAAEFAKVGINVTAVCRPQGHPLAKTRSVQKILPYSGLNPLGSLETAIREVRPDLIVPADDRAVQHLHELHSRIHRKTGGGNEISAAIERSLGHPEGYAVVSARYDFLEMAREEGLRVPPTGLVSTEADLLRWSEAHRPPWILKADGSWSGMGVRTAHTPADSEQAFSDLVRKYRASRALKRAIVNRDPYWLRPWWSGTKPAVIVQDYVQGRPANCVVACWEGKILAGIAVEVACTKGLNGPATVVRIVESPEMFTAARKIAGRLRLTGMFGLDFVIEKETGLLYLIEMNPRFTPPCHLRLGKGRDLVGALAAQITGEPFKEAPPVTPEEYIAYYPSAMRAEENLPPNTFHDAPQDEPELERLLMRPWPECTLTFRLYDYAYRKAVSLKSSLTSPLRSFSLKA